MVIFLCDINAIYDYFLGYNHLKEERRVTFGSSANVFAILPTGFGKTPCFACLLNIFDRILFPLPLVISQDKKTKFEEAMIIMRIDTAKTTKCTISIDVYHVYTSL